MGYPVAYRRTRTGSDAARGFQPARERSPGPRRDISRPPGRYSPTRPYIPARAKALARLPAKAPFGSFVNLPGAAAIANPRVLAGAKVTLRFLTRAFPAAGFAATALELYRDHQQYRAVDPIIVPQGSGWSLFRDCQKIGGNGRFWGQNAQVTSLGSTNCANAQAKDWTVPFSPNWKTMVFGRGYFATPPATNPRIDNDKWYTRSTTGPGSPTWRPIRTALRGVTPGLPNVRITGPGKKCGGFARLSGLESLSGALVGAAGRNRSAVGGSGSTRRTRDTGLKPMRHGVRRNATRRRPPPGTKEVKPGGIGKRMLLLRTAVGTTTEVIDIFNAAYRSLPEENQRARSTWYKAKTVLRNAHRLDLDKFAENLVSNLAQDMLFGFLGKLDQSAAKCMGRTMGFGVGPWDTITGEIAYTLEQERRAAERRALAAARHNANERVAGAVGDRSLVPVDDTAGGQYRPHVSYYQAPAPEKRRLSIY